MTDLQGKKVVVVGFGRSGEAAVRLLLTKGARVVVSERRARKNLPQGLVSSLEEEGVLFETGGHRPETMKDADLVVVSPGVPLDAYAPAIFSGVPVIGELELAYQYLKGQKVVAITGTNGKTTTTAMVTDILRLSGYRVFIGGNFGTPLSEFILSGQKAEMVVLEVSSFQLETTVSFAPDVALLLNITPDHLERYLSFEDYARAKLRLFSAQRPEQVAILPEELPPLKGALEEIRGETYFFGKNPYSHGLLKEGAFELHLGPEQAPETYTFAGFKLLGEHNRLNFVAAALAARLAGATPEGVRRALQSFVGFPHRLEFVGCFGGVYFVNDSKATNVDATLKALEGLSGPIILILGGTHKGASYRPLAPFIEEKVRFLILIGDSRFIMAEELADLTYTRLVPTLEEAVALAISEAISGDTVLLSPAAASFDQFENYQERGDLFREIVLAYAPEYLGEDERAKQVTYH